VNRLTVLIMTVAALLPLGGGCQTKPTLEQKFAQIKVGQTDSTTVLGLLPAKDMLHSANSVSVLYDQNWLREAGVVTFNAADSMVQRWVYVVHRSRQVMPFAVEEQTRLALQTVIPPEVLEQPYESDYRKQNAILRFCYVSMVADVKSFAEDERTTSLMGMGRTILGMGIADFEQHPRQDVVLRETGLVYDHPTLGKCRMVLRPDAGNIYSLKIEAGMWADPLVHW
jgi:hypothetical protein